jgi:hypothetical protein
MVSSALYDSYMPITFEQLNMQWKLWDPWPKAWESTQKETSLAQKL